MAKPRLTLNHLRKLTSRLREREKIEPPVEKPSEVHLAVGHSRNQFIAWTRQFGIAPTRIGYIDQGSVLYEGVHDFNLIILPGSKLDKGLLDMLKARSANIYDTRDFYPVAEGGVIKRWVRYQVRSLP